MTPADLGRATAGLWRQATRRWRTRALTAEARDLIARKLFARADALLETALAARPADPGLTRAYAMVAHDQGHYRAAIGRWQAALQAAPDEPFCHAGLAANLREIGELVEAQAIIDAAARLFPRDLSVVTEAARVAEASGRFADAARLWAAAAARRRPAAEWLRGQAHALAMIGDFDAAQRVLDAALMRHPDHRGLLAVRGILAYARGDIAGAVSLWTAYRRQFPDDGTGWEHLGRALEAQALSQGDVPDPRAAPAAVDMVDDEATRQLMLHFESVGDACEFGAVQRRFSAEPLGLLRWNDVSLAGLTAGLAARFEGMGEPANTELATLDNGEFFVRDRRWNLGMHTFLFAGQVAREPLFEKMCRRVVFLREKFLADLAVAEKIFVFRSPDLGADDLAALHRALRAYGPIRLLVVLPATPQEPTPFTGAPGEVVPAGDGCAIGFLGRLGVAEGGYWDIAYDDWVSICRKAHAMMA